MSEWKVELLEKQKIIKNTAAVYQDLQAEMRESIFQKLWQNF